MTRLTDAEAATLRDALETDVTNALEGRMDAPPNLRPAVEAILSARLAHAPTERRDTGTQSGAQRFEAAWREACANHENVAEAMGRLLDEQGARLARVEMLADFVRQQQPPDPDTGDRLVSFLALMDALDPDDAALAPEVEGATS